MPVRRDGAAAAVVLTAKDWGQEGGNQVMAEFRSPGRAPTSRCSVAVNGKLIEVFLATDASGAPELDGQAGRRRDQRQAGGRRARHGDDLPRQRGRRHRASRARASTSSDFLNAPASVARGPFQQHLYRIGAHRDGSKVGVFLFCQQHAREWTTSLTCQETAHELVENYATDPQTKQLLDNVEVFISPNSNPDGAHYSMYDSTVQRKTMPNYCPTTGNSDPAARTTWGVDMNRNSGEYSLFDGYFGASTSLHERDLRRPERVLRAGDPQREVGRGHVPEHQVRRTTSTPTAATSCGRRAPTRTTASAPRRRRRTSASRSTSSRPARRSSSASRTRAAR